MPPRPAHSQDAIAALLGQLDVEGDAEPRRIARRLAGMPGMVPILIRGLAVHPRIRVRRWLAEAVASSGDPRALGAIRRALRDPAMTVRLHALIALANIGDAVAGRAALPLLADPSGGIRVNAIAVVAQLRPAGACAPLVRATRDAQWYVRQAAAQAIGVLRCGRGAAALRPLLADPRPAVVRAARIALERMEPTLTPR